MAIVLYHIWLDIGSSLARIYLRILKHTEVPEAGLQLSVRVFQSGLHVGQGKGRASVTVKLGQPPPNHCAGIEGRVHQN